MHLLEQHDIADTHYQGLLARLEARLDSLIWQMRIYPDDEAIKIGLVCRIGEKKEPADYQDIAALILSQYDPLFGLVTCRELSQFKLRHDPSAFAYSAVENLWQGSIQIPAHVLDAYPDLVSWNRNPIRFFEPTVLFLSAHVLLPVDERSEVLLARGRYVEIRNAVMQENVKNAFLKTDALLGKYITARS
ncbi:MAG: hypothetical protein ABIJ21_07240 [Nanoarchaeota archaeon]